MIRNSINRTKEATFGVTISDNEKGIYARPQGTCFFISQDGYLLTAYHVIEGLNDENISITKPPVMHWEDPNWMNAISLIQNITIIETWPQFDLALLKADFDANKEKGWAKVRSGFPWLPVSFEQQFEGTPIYMYGYPLPDHHVNYEPGLGHLTLNTIRERTTSAIIAATREEIGPVVGGNNPKHYVLDKALNYGNSGGPVVLSESGAVISVVVRFQPVVITQQDGGEVELPSLYGISSSLMNIEDYLRINKIITKRRMRRKRKKE